MQRLRQSPTDSAFVQDPYAFYDRARAAGVDVTLQVEEGLIHVWHMYPSLPESERALARIGAFVRAHARVEARNPPPG